MATNELGVSFWRNIERIKLKKRPEKYWKEICAETGVNYQTFRGAKVRGALLNSNSLVALSLYFDCDQSEFFAEPADTLAERRQRVCRKIDLISESQLEMIERLLGIQQ